MQHLLLAVLLAASIQLSVNGAWSSDSLASDAAESRDRKTYQGLIPFPRIGRSRGMNQMVDYKNYNDVKREGGLIPFPRTGRSEPKRNGGGTTGALWFGPRLGKRNNLDYNTVDNMLAGNLMDFFTKNKLARDDLFDQPKLESDPPLPDQFM